MHRAYLKLKLLKIPYLFTQIWMLPKIVTSLTKYIIDGEKAYACTIFPIQDHTIAIAIAVEDEYSIR